MDLGGSRDEKTTEDSITIRDPHDTIGAVTSGGSGERATGTPNTIYDLASVLFHALESGASYDTYIEDAERERDGELSVFFRRIRDEDSKRADEAQRLLAERTSTAARSGGGASVSAEGVAAGVPPALGANPEQPGTEPIREDETPRIMGEVPPPTEIPGGIPPQAPTVDVQRGPSPQPETRETSIVEEERTEREEDKGLVDKAKDFLRGEDNDRGDREEVR